MKNSKTTHLKQNFQTKMLSVFKTEARQNQFLDL